MHVTVATEGTALTLARAVGMPADRAVTGDEVERATAAELQGLLARNVVCSRARPEHKLRIVEALQARGEIVAVTGDGVNDAPALKKAEVGVAMGRRGSDVAREVADIVLLDDDFATIVAAVEEGRTIRENIGKFLRFLFATNLAEVAVVTGGWVAADLMVLRDSGGALLLPVTAAQLLWINLETDGAAALALGVDANPGVLDRPPRPASVPILDRRSVGFVLAAGAGLSCAAAWLLVVQERAGVDPAEIRTAVLLLLALGQLALAYPARGPGKRLRRNRPLLLATFGAAALPMLLLGIPALRKVFAISWLGPGTATAVALLVLAALGVSVLASRLLLRRPRA
jgi:Ca2+-transporting ATPase